MKNYHTLNASGLYHLSTTRDRQIKTNTLLSLFSLSNNKITAFILFSILHQYKFVIIHYFNILNYYFECKVQVQAQQDFLVQLFS